MDFSGPKLVRTKKNGKNVYECADRHDCDQYRAAQTQMASSSSEEDDSVDPTQDFQMEEDDTREAILRQEYRDWLALNGKALFALEVSKFLAKERKSHSVKPAISRTRGIVSPLANAE